MRRHIDTFFRAVSRKHANSVVLPHMLFLSQKADVRRRYDQKRQNRRTDPGSDISK